MEHISNNQSDLDEYFELFIKQSRDVQGKSLVTIRNYRNNFELLKKFKSDLNLDDLTAEFIINFYNYLQTREREIGNDLVVKPLKNSSIATIRGKLSAFFSWLIENKHLNKDPFSEIPYPDVSYTDKRAFTKDEFDKIYLAVSRDIPWESLFLRRRNLAMILFFAMTGVRKGELLGLKLSDINLKDRMVTVRGETSKSKRTRYIRLSSELLVYLEEYIACRDGYKTEYFWVSSTQDRPFTEHGLKHFVNHLTDFTKINCHVHRFRHTFSVSYYLQTNDPVGLNRVLGHRGYKQTYSYLRSLPDSHTNKQMESLKLANIGKIDYNHN